MSPRGNWFNIIKHKTVIDNSITNPLAAGRYVRSGLTLQTQKGEEGEGVVGQREKKKLLSNLCLQLEDRM